MADVPKKLPRYQELPCVPGNPPKTAWGLFGADDNVGMFNLQTPDVVVAAARLVRKGTVFAMNWEQEKPNPPLFGRGRFRHTVFRESPVGHHGDDLAVIIARQLQRVAHVGHLSVASDEPGQSAPGGGLQARAERPQPSNLE